MASSSSSTASSRIAGLESAVVITFPPAARGLGPHLATACLGLEERGTLCSSILRSILWMPPVVPTGPMEL